MPEPEENHGWLRLSNHHGRNVKITLALKIDFKARSTIKKGKETQTKKSLR